MSWSTYGKPRAQSTLRYDGKNASDDVSKPAVVVKKEQAREHKPHNFLIDEWKEDMNVKAELVGKDAYYGITGSIYDLMANGLTFPAPRGFSNMAQTVQLENMERNLTNAIEMAVGYPIAFRRSSINPDKQSGTFQATFKEMKALHESHRGPILDVSWEITKDGKVQVKVTDYKSLIYAQDAFAKHVHGKAHWIKEHIRLRLSQIPEGNEKVPIEISNGGILEFEGTMKDFLVRHCDGRKKFDAEFMYPDNMLADIAANKLTKGQKAVIDSLLSDDSEKKQMHMVADVMDIPRDVVEVYQLLKINIKK